MKTVTYFVPTIHCNHCTHTIAMELSEIEGVSEVVADVHTQLVDITFEAPATEQQLIDTLEAINYPVTQ